MPEQKRALLLGSSFSAAPILHALRARSISVVVCGSLPNDPCHQYADGSVYADYSSESEVARILETNHFDYVVPSCNDAAYLTGSALAEKYGFQGYDNHRTTLIVHTKSEFRDAAVALGVPVPQAQRYRKGERISDLSLRFPLLVKPVDSFSGRGVTRVNCESALADAMDCAFQVTQAEEVVVEEFVDGSLHSHSAFLRNQRVEIDFFVDEFCSVYPWQVDCSNHPSVLSQSVRHEVREIINRFAEGLGLADGLLHTQFICNKNMVWIIESMRRCPGDLYGSLVSYSAGVNYADLYIRSFIGERIAAENLASQPRFIGRHTVSVDEPVIVSSFGYEFLATAVEVVPLKTSAEALGVAPYDKLAILFAEFETSELMERTTPRFAELIRLRRLGGIEW